MAKTADERYAIAVKALREVASMDHAEGCTSTAPLHECGCYAKDERQIATAALAELGEIPIVSIRPARFI